VKIRESGAERPVTAAEAFLLQLTKRGLEGDDAAARASLAVIEEARERRGAGQSRISAIVHVCVAPGSVTSELEPLRMARKLDPYRETARIALEPWLVEAALARLSRPLRPLAHLTRSDAQMVDRKSIIQTSFAPFKQVAARLLSSLPRLHG
jgi:hypothetical protein